MKPTAFCSIVFLLYLLPVTAQTKLPALPKPVRTILEAAADSESSIENQSITHHYYNANGSIRMEEKHIWYAAGNNWTPAFRYEYRYDNDGRLLENLELEWQADGSLHPKTRTVYTYYPNPKYLDGEPQIQRNETWDSSKNLWIPDIVMINVGCDSTQGCLAGTLSSTSVINYRLPGRYSTRTYRKTCNGGMIRNLESEQLYKDTTRLKMEPVERYEYKYRDGSTSTEFDTLYTFDRNVVNTEWVPFPRSRNIRRITGNTKVHDKDVFSLIEGAWVHHSVSTTEYNDLGQKLLDVVTLWDAGKSRFYESSRVEYRYNPDHSVAVISEYFFNGNADNPGLYLSSRVRYEYAP